MSLDLTKVIAAIGRSGADVEASLMGLNNQLSSGGPQPPSVAVPPAPNVQPAPGAGSAVAAQSPPMQLAGPVPAVANSMAPPVAPPGAPAAQVRGMTQLPPNGAPPAMPGPHQQGLPQPPGPPQQVAQAPSSALPLPGGDNDGLAVVGSILSAAPGPIGGIGKMLLQQTAKQRSWASANQNYKRLIAEGVQPGEAAILARDGKLMADYFSTKRKRGWETQDADRDFGRELYKSRLGWDFDAAKQEDQQRHLQEMQDDRQEFDLNKKSDRIKLYEYNVEQLRARGVDEKYIPTIGEFEGDLKQKEAGGSAFQVKFAEKIAGKVAEDAQAANKDSGMLRTIRSQRTILEQSLADGGGKFYGAFGPMFQKAYEIGEATGWNSEEMNKALAGTQTFQSQAGIMVGNIIRLFGSGTGLSDADREYAKLIAGGNTNITQRGLKRILDLAEYRTWENAHKSRERIQRLGGNPDVVDDPGPPPPKPEGYDEGRAPEWLQNELGIARAGGSKRVNAAPGAPPVPKDYNPRDASQVLKRWFQ